MRYRYSKWDDTQEIFPLDEEDIMDSLSDHILYPGDLNEALRGMAWSGVSTREGARLMGIEDLLQRLHARRKDLLNRYDLSSALEEIARELEEIIETERATIDRRLQEARDRLADSESENDALSPEARAELLNIQTELKEPIAAKNREFLEALPSDAGGRIKALMEYEFMDKEAERRFEQLVQRLRQQALDTYFRDLSKQLKEISPDQLSRMKSMLQQLNRMLEQRVRGEDIDFEGFMREFGDFFGPDPPSNLEELISQMAQRTAQMRSLLASLPEDMRESLRQTLDTVLRDDELRKELAQFALTLEQLVPMDELQNQHNFGGEESLSLSEAMKLMERLQGMEELEKQLRRARRAGLNEVDPDLLEDTLGEEGVQALDQLRNVAEMLERAGYLTREGGRLALTPKGIRRLGEKALRDIFRLLKRDRLGGHDLHRLGRGGDLGDGTKKYEFGDPFAVDLKGTFFNTVMREGAGVPLHLQPEDFEVYRTEDLTQCATVLMLDLSLSMALRGSFPAAKKMAMALDSLLRTKFPRDRFHIVGFSTYARELKPDTLPLLGWDEFDPYTNLQDGLILAQKLLSKVKGGNRQIIIVSDGEPTAHIEGGHLYFQYPPSYRTLELTLREVKECTRKGIVINTFMLDTNPYLMRFVSELGRINRGRVFFTSPEKLGEYVLVDYLARKPR